MCRSVLYLYFAVVSTHSTNVGRYSVLRYKLISLYDHNFIKSVRTRRRDPFTQSTRLLLQLNLWPTRNVRYAAIYELKQNPSWGFNITWRSKEEAVRIRWE